MSNNELISSLNNTIKVLREENANNLIGELENKIEKIDGKELLVTTLKNLTHEQEDTLAHNLVDKHPSLLLFLAIDNGGKKDIVAARGKDLASIKAGNVMKECSALLSGRGGGRPDVAFGATDDVSNLNKVKDHLLGLLK